MDGIKSMPTPYNWYPLLAPFAQMWFYMVGKELSRKACRLANIAWLVGINAI